MTKANFSITESLFIDRGPKETRWFEDLMTTILVDEPQICLTFLAIRKKINFGRISHIKARELIEKLFQNYPLLLMGMSIFLEPKAYLEIPKNLLESWKKAVDCYSSKEYLQANCKNEGTTQISKPNSNFDETEFFYWFLYKKAEETAIENGSYGKVMLARLKINKIMYKYTTFNYARGETATEFVSFFIDQFKKFCQSIENPGLFWEFKNIFCLYRMERKSEENVCYDVYNLLRKEEKFYPFLINFNQCLPHLPYFAFQVTNVNYQ